jgi:hypothetical protein
MNNQKNTTPATGSGITKNLLRLFGLERQKIDAGYNQEFITGTVIQLLEFADIIETSKDPNTVLRVYKLLTSRRKTLISASNNPGFTNDFEKGCEQYSQFYDNRPISDIRILEKSDEEMENYFFLHYKRCWLDYVSEQNTIIKQATGRNNREVRRSILWEKFRMISEDAEWEINDLAAFYLLKSELSGAIKKTIAWHKSDFAV